MSRMSRDKGKVAERDVGHILDRHHLPYLREQDGRTQGADFLVDGRFTLEVKRREQLRLVEWHRQLEAATPAHLTPVVAWRPSREPWRASLLLADLLDLARAAA